MREVSTKGLLHAAVRHGFVAILSGLSVLVWPRPALSNQTAESSCDGLEPLERVTEVYNFEADFSTNVNTDSSTWSYRTQQDSLVRDGVYDLLGEYNGSYYGFPAWNPVPTDELDPAYTCITKNTMGHDLTSPFFLPNGHSAIVPPGVSAFATDQGLAVVSWLSPRAGDIRLSYLFNHVDRRNNGGGGGVNWYVDRGSATGEIDQGYVHLNSTPLKSTNLTVTAGERINFVLDCDVFMNNDWVRLYAEIAYTDSPPPPPPPPILYVDAGSTNPVAPYEAWETAAARIQDAIDAALDGATVLVADGVYDEGGAAVHGGPSNRVAIVKRLHVRSVHGADSTVIRGVGPVGADAMRCAYVSSNAVLEGFTLTGGRTWLIGSPTTETSGGGALCEPGGVLSACIVSGNAAFAYGGGVSGGALANCLVVSNSAYYGGGLFGTAGEHCTVADNTATAGGGGAHNSSLVNGIVYFNASLVGEQDCVNVSFDGGCSPGGEGVLTDNPRFVDRPAGNYRLAFGSPCIDAGRDASLDSDLDANPRPQPARYGGTPLRDLGAYEFSPAGRYVSATGGNIPPYASWQHAATNVQAALDISGDGDLILARDGTYRVGRELQLTNAVTLAALSGGAVIDADGSGRVARLSHPGAVLDGFTLRNGSVGDRGAGVLVENGATVRNLVVENCRALELGSRGGGIFLTGGSRAEDCLVTGSTADHGCGLYADASTALRCDLLGNTGAFGFGGGAYLRDGAAMSDCVVVSNENRMAGGVYVENSTVATTMVVGNRALQHGGGVYLQGGSVARCRVQENEAGLAGGGAYVSGGGVVRSCLAVGNEAGQYGGGACVTAGDIENATLAHNHAVQYAGGAAVETAGRVRNCIVMFNTAGVDADARVAAGAQVEHSCIAPAPLGPGNFSLDPRLAGAEDYRLRVDSPCMDRGTNQAWMAAARDLAGEARVWVQCADDGSGPISAIVDIGAYESTVRGGGMRWAGGLMEVDWVAMPGGRLQMQGAPWPDGPVWADVGGVVTAGQSVVTTVTTNAPGDAGFLRMIWLR